MEELPVPADQRMLAAQTGEFGLGGTVATSQAGSTSSGRARAASSRSSARGAPAGAWVGAAAWKVAGWVCITASVLSTKGRGGGISRRRGP